MIKKWFFVTRPWSFVVSATPVIMTVVFLIWKGFLPDINWINAALALVGVIFFHAAGNVLSDYFDYKTGIDNPDAFCVPNLVSGEFKAKDYLVYSIILFAIGCLIGIVLTFRSSLLLLAIGISGALLTLLYSRSKFYALGDLLIFIVFGVLPMIGTSLVSASHIEWSTLLLSVPVGFITVAVLHSNNTRDIPTDLKAGIRSFASVIGEKASLAAYIFYIWSPIVYTIIMTAVGLFPVWTLAVILSAPVVLANTKQALKYKTEGLSAFNQLDLMTAKLQMVSSICLVAGFVVSSII